MTDPEELQRQAVQYTEQAQAATTNLVHALSQNWANAMRTATGVGSRGPSSPPSPAEVLDRSFDFTIQMIEQQRVFAHHLLKAGVPVAQAMEQATDSVAERAGETGGASDAGGRTTTPS